MICTGIVVVTDEIAAATAAAVFPIKKGIDRVVVIVVVVVVVFVTSANDN